MHHLLLTDFSVLRPPFETSQEIGFEWMSAAHLEAEKHAGESFSEKHFVQEIQKKINQYCCKKEKISKRGHFLEDFLHQEWERMHIYQLSTSPFGKGIKERFQLYAQLVEQSFERFYPDNSSSPDDLIHVTCTGYNSPSAAQKLVLKKGWEKETHVTHAYHMGCLAAIPAIRIATGFCREKKKKVDIVHTELCTLHLNPSLHSADQLVGQSLFADGLIKYSITSHPEHKRGFHLLAIQEEMLPETEELMQWECEEWGFKMTLSKEIPFKINASIAPFVERLIMKANIDPSEAFQRGIFAIHPGGPKIIELLERTLSLSKWQTALSEEILFKYGNMSSATLPHIWEAILASNEYPVGSLVIGLGFGPGLNIGGVVLKKYD